MRHSFDSAQKHVVSTADTTRRSANTQSRRRTHLGVNTLVRGDKWPKSLIHLCSLFTSRLAELYLDREIERITPPSALDFYRDYIAKNKPVVITEAMGDWPALKKWRMKNYLRSKLHQSSVTIDRVPVTGGGRGFGDSVVGGYFVTPSEEQMPFGAFLDWLDRKDKPPEDGVLYCQHQNSSLTSEFHALTADVPEFAWATNAFNCDPDAVNLWFGEDRSVSTLHQDPYENMYAVVQGRKRFLLYPPSDYHWLDKREYPKAKWKYDPSTRAPTSTTDAPATVSDAAASNAASSIGDASSSSPTSTSAAPATATTSSSSSSSADPLSRFTLEPSPDGERTAWFDLEPEQDPEQDDAPVPDAAAAAEKVRLNLRVAPDAAVQELPPPGPFPPYSTHPPMSSALRREYASPMWVDLDAGEVLYLPSLWFHRVAQKGVDDEGKTIAVNFWSDERRALAQHIARGMDWAGEGMCC